MRLGMCVVIRREKHSIRMNDVSDCHQGAWNSYYKKECKLGKLRETEDEVTNLERLILRIFIKLSFLGGYEEYESHEFQNYG